MTDKALKVNPQSNSVNALRVAAYEYQHSTGPINVFYSAQVDMPSYMAGCFDSAVGANKVHATIVNKGTEIIRIRKIKVVQNIVAAVTGTSSIMLTVEGLNPSLPSPTGALPNPQPMRKHFTDWPDPEVEVIKNPTANINIVSGYIIDIDSLSIEEAPTTNKSSIEFLKKESELSSIILKQNQGLAIKQGSVAGVGALNVLFYWTLA
jgi:hypothetical protein